MRGWYCSGKDSVVQENSVFPDGAGLGQFVSQKKMLNVSNG